MAATTDNAEKVTLEKAVDKMIDLASSTNKYLLDTTEQAIDASFNVAYKSLDVTSKIVKRGLEITATQQEFAFDMLNGLKKKVFKN